MTTTKYADGRLVRNSFMADAIEDLRTEYPDMETEMSADGARTLVWASETDAAGDDGRRAVAVILIA